MTTRTLTTTGAAVMMTALALSACTATTDGAAPSATPTATATATPSATPIPPVKLPEEDTAAVRWTDQIGAPEPQTVRLVGEPVRITVDVRCETEDAEVTIAIDGLYTSGSSCIADPDTTYGTGPAGNSGSMKIAVDQDALITVTVDPADTRWSGAVSTGPRVVTPE